MTTTASPTRPARSLDELRARMRARLEGIAPDFEVELQAQLAWEIERLKEETGAILLGHNYMAPGVYEVADHTGDSLQLARLARDAEPRVGATGELGPIVFCGVEFMAETAKIVNPDRTVLLPAKKAGCSLAESIGAEDVRRLREAYPGVPIVAYVNTDAATKAEVDICCTSSNAVKVIESLDTDTVIMVPDEYLARNVARETGKRILVPRVADAREGRLPVLNGEGMVGWGGRCEVHEKFTVRDIEDARAQFPDVAVLAHPECSPEVVEAADFSGSTSAMIRHVQESGARRYLLLTECAMGDNIASEMGSAEILRLCSVRCPHMNQITLENVRDSLLHGERVIEVPEPVRVRALRAIDRMLAVG